MICAEGYLFELERRGYVQAGAFVPEAVLDHPEVVAQLHRDFVHAGSDVVEAFTYYAHREKLRIIGKEHLLEEMNRQALAIAKAVARETGTLFAGRHLQHQRLRRRRRAKKTVRAMFEEQVAWAADAGVDFIIAETFSLRRRGRARARGHQAAGLPAVVTMTIHQAADARRLELPRTLQALEDAGADVVGLNCCRGPGLCCRSSRAIREAVSVPCRRAACPVPHA